MRDTIKTVRRRLCAPRPDVAARTFRLGAAALAAVKLALTAFQMGYAWVGGAPLDAVESIGIETAECGWIRTVVNILARMTRKRR